VNDTQPKAEAPRRQPKRGWRLLRVGFRWCRIGVLLLLLIAIVLGLFLNHVGLPEPIKERVIGRLRAQGWDVAFSRMRLRWYRGIVVEDVQVQPLRPRAGPHLFAEEAEGSLNFAALKNFQLDVTRLTMKDARLFLPLNATNRPAQTVCLQDIHGELRFLPHDVWDLYSLRGNCLGARIQLSGLLTNASALRDLDFSALTRPAPDKLEIWRHRVWNHLRQVRYERPPELIARFRADARDTNSFRAAFRLIAEQVSSPWGSGTNVFLGVWIVPAPRPSDRFRLEVRVNAENVRTIWGEAEKLDLQGQFRPAFDSVLPAEAELTVGLTAANASWGKADALTVSATLSAPLTNSASRLTRLKATASGWRSEWAQVPLAQAEARLTHSATNFLPATVELDLASDRLETRSGHGQLKQLQVRGTLPSLDQLALFRTNLVWPERLGNLPFEADLSAGDVVSPKLNLETILLSAHWQPPQLTLDTKARLYGGAASVRAGLNSDTRELFFRGAADLNLQHIRHLLATNLQEPLDTFVWEQPPRLQAQGRLVLPAWTNRHPEWIAEVEPTLAVEGTFEAGPGLHYGVSFDSARTFFALSNSVWRLLDLIVTRPEGEVRGEYVSDNRTHDFRWRWRSGIDPKALRPALNTDAARQLLNDFVFTTPPAIEGDIWGNWRDPAGLGFAARVAMTNLTFRGEAIKGCTTRVAYTNKFLSFVEPQLQREGEMGQAAGIGVDLADERLFLTNAFGNLNAYAIARAIGTQTLAAIEPYVFDASPTGRVWGMVDLTGDRHDDAMRFELSGGPFRWRQFRLPHIAGRVDWIGQTVALTNVQGTFYGGRIAGQAHFNFAAPTGAVFSFNTLLTNVELRLLVVDIASKTNQLEGALNGALVVNAANTADPRSWFGYGHLRLTNGLLWDIPVFGVFSPILNAFAPGLGNSRAKKAGATFVITNSVIHSSDLQIDATAMRMQYDLAVDFEHRIEGRVEAELLRNVPGLGLVVSKVLWPVTKLFEYKLAGTFDQPKATPVFFVPRILLLPFRPIKTIKDLFPDENQKALPR
jgi:hypothetical protein